jgi:hypothetical protein
MAKLFIFAIGGTGSRVLKALTMLMAAGVKVENTEKIIPIIIDPDSANGDLTRTIELLKSYREIKEKGYHEKSSFFSTAITSLNELGDAGFTSDQFKFDIEGVKEELFRQFIGMNEMEQGNKAFTSLLFSEANLEADMDVGFKGNPNIGSVVLNKFKDTEYFQKFAGSFEDDDRIFIISSIFGGTGAAGFPLILKNIRNAQHPLPHHHFLQRSKIGAVTILPYFSVEKREDVEINSDTFIAKTKAALSYYARNVSGNQSVDALYYIGDKVTNELRGADGAQVQRNKAHFIELAAALAIVDFMSIKKEDFNFENGRVTNPKYFEFGIFKETNSIKFSDLAKETNEIIAKPLTQFSLFKIFMEKHYDSLQKENGEAWASHGNNLLKTEHIDKRLLNNLTVFFRYFGEWLHEMKSSEVHFNPIDITKHGSDILNLVDGFPEKTGFISSLNSGKGINYFRQILSKEAPKFDTLNSNHKLMALFSKATDEIVEERIKI